MKVYRFNGYDSTTHTFNLTSSEGSPEKKGETDKIIEENLSKLIKENLSSSHEMTVAIKEGWGTRTVVVKNENDGRNLLVDLKLLPSNATDVPKVNTTDVPKANITNLPPELFEEVLRGMTLKEQKTAFYLSEQAQKGATEGTIRLRNMYESTLIRAINLKKIPVKDWGMDTAELIEFLSRKGKLIHYLDCEGVKTDPLELVKRCPELTELNLASHHIGAEGVKALAALELNNLTSLNLRRNDIRDEGAKTLATSKSLKNLTLLDLSYNSISDQGAMSFSSLAESSLENLKSLNLEKNNISAAGVNMLPALLKDLTSLNLAGNPFGGVTAIPVLESFQDLQFLDLRPYA